jgi:hypothetical protein
VTITGKSFAKVSAVKFGSFNAASFKVNSATSITAVSPPEPAGLADIRVTTPGGTSPATSTDHFEFLPTVTAVVPNSGPTSGGTHITVQGTGFSTVPKATVFKFGSSKATSVTCTSSTECTAVTPAHAAEVVDVTATVSRVTSTKNPPFDRFTYQ